MSVPDVHHPPDGFSKTYAMTGWRMGGRTAPGSGRADHPADDEFQFMHRQLYSDGWHGSARRPEFRRITCALNSSSGVLSLGRIDQRIFLPKGAFYVFPNTKKTGWKSSHSRTHFLTGWWPRFPGPHLASLAKPTCASACRCENLQQALDRI